MSLTGQNMIHFLRTHHKKKIKKTIIALAEKSIQKLKDDSLNHSDDALNHSDDVLKSEKGRLEFAKKNSCSCIC